MLSFLINLPRSLLLVLRLLVEAVAAVFELSFRALLALLLPGGDGGLRTRLGALLSQTRLLRLVFAALRGLSPNLRLPLVLVKAYENGGTVVVSRSDDVMEVLNRQEEFEVVYGLRMEAMTGGRNFFLGMRDGPEYSRDVLRYSRPRSGHLDRVDNPAVLVPVR